MEPANPRFRIGLAEVASRAGAPALARATLEEAIARAPARPDLRAAAIRAALRAGDAAAAESLAEAARRDGAADASVLRLLAQAAASQGRTEAAASSLAAAWKLDPADPTLRHFAAAAGLLPPPDRAPIELLGARIRSARVPGLLRAAILAHAAPPTGTQLGPVLDLGCGPGLAAVALSDLPLGPFIGVDVAPAMQALPRSLYAELHDADPIAFLANDQRTFPLILAADLLDWLGPLDPLFAALAPRLAPRGAFIVALDSIPRPLTAHHEWRLVPDGHYAHTQASLERAARAADLVPRHLQSERLRNESNASDTGMIAVLGHAAHAG
jgi:predicted TPR repeat methyltransferase